MATERLPLAEFDLLRSVTRVVASADSADGLADDVCAAALDAGYAFAAVVEADLVRARAGADPGHVEDALADQSGRELVESALDGGTAVSRSSLGGKAARLASSGGANALVAVPLERDETTFGTLVLGAVREPDADALATLTDVGIAVAHGLAARRSSAKRERLEREFREHQRKVEQLHAAAAEMVGCVRESEILDSAVETAQDILEFDICAIDRYEDGYLVPRAASEGMPADGARKVSVEDGIAGKTYRTQSSYLFDDVQRVEEAVPAQSGYRSVISVPIDEVGVFQAGSREVGAFTDEDVELSELLMSHVAETLKRAQSERALRESEAQYRTVVEGSHDAIFVYADDEIAYVNDRSCELTGYDREHLVGNDGYEVVHPEDRAVIADVVDLDDVEESMPASFTARLQRADGGVRHCEFRLTSIAHDGEQAVLGSIRDVTERVEHERRLERQNERLEEFASILSHDLRNPLNVAQGSLQLSRETDDPAHLDRLGRALDRMESLVQDVLDLARKGRTVHEAEVVSLPGVARDAWQHVDGPEATLDVDVAGVDVEADRGRLQTLFENLFRNAVEHAGPDVRIEVGALVDGFYVADDGPGIPDGETDRIFDRGYSTVQGGTGFGLAIVRNVGEAHGWDVSVANSSVGARFEVTSVTRA